MYPRLDLMSKSLEMWLKGQPHIRVNNTRAQNIQHQLNQTKLRPVPCYGKISHMTTNDVTEKLPNFGIVYNFSFFHRQSRMVNICFFQKNVGTRATLVQGILYYFNNSKYLKTWQESLTSNLCTIYMEAFAQRNSSKRVSLIFACSRPRAHHSSLKLIKQWR